MIARYRSDEELFQTSLALVERSGVAEELENLAAARRGQGGRPSRGIQYTLKAILVVMTWLTARRVTPSLAEVIRVIVHGLDDEQLSTVGIKVEAAERVRLQSAMTWDAEYRRVHLWLSRRLTLIDAHADLPARRVLNSHDKLARAQRSPAALEAAVAADDLCRRLCNLLIAASIHDPAPDGYVGDIVVDETIFDVSQVSQNVGASAAKHRSASPAAAFYARNQGTVQPGARGGRGTDKLAFGVGVTAVIRVGKPTAMRKVVPLITAIDISSPTPGSVRGLANALDHHRANGFDPRHNGAKRSPNARWPYLTVDMGYNPLDGFAELLVERKYSMIASYPKGWGVVSPTEDPRRPHAPRPDQVPGPLIGHGDVYCPAAAHLLKAGPLVVRMRDQDTAQLQARDRRLAQLLPLLMGTNSRIKVAARTPGRPRAEGSPIGYKLDVVCPAVQGRVRCAHKPDSLLFEGDLPTVEPDWAAADFRCCSKSQTTITLTPNQLKRYQGSMTPGTWEHQLHFEAYRAATERQFSILKSPHITALPRLSFGPRRDPLLKLLIAIAVAVSNLNAQDEPSISEIDSVSARMKALERQLGWKPAKAPPRT